MVGLSAEDTPTTEPEVALVLKVKPPEARLMSTPALWVKEAVPEPVVGPWMCAPIAVDVRSVKPLPEPQPMLTVRTLVTSSKVMPAPISPPVPGVPERTVFSLPGRSPKPAEPWRSKGMMAAWENVGAKAATARTSMRVCFMRLERVRCRYGASRKRL